ncbi:hypothetical protein QTH90_29075 [Variovorax sp. J2P1-59]|uniref:hypothetical protein n=1 Tax=Variovorax flavidus TaxID=3053501 RepID=UPI0025790DBF|nr:hypothetical protein [Variovorax sp. J2P1-59]MDM0078492.1 hypothetical protein [Variovorax sp. J2P1-59]
MTNYADNTVPGSRSARIPGLPVESGSTTSGVSWAAILAGAAGAASLSLILVLLGTGLGLSSISPWTGQGASATTIGVATILWITFTQIAASGLGGYLAGRLRTKWADVQTDEVYFRDTAHGFLAWGVATILTAALLTSTIGTILGAGAQAGASALGGAATAATATTAGVAMASNPPAGTGGSSSSTDYYVDSLFRKDAPSSSADASPIESNGAGRGSGPINAEASRIVVNAIRTGSLPPDDAKYVAQQVSERTGLSQQDAERRVNDTYAKAQATLKEAEAKAKAAADAARKASAYASLWLFVSLLIGAFVASFAATFGGRRRDF